MKGRRHHVVSEGYQRHFAVGKQVLLIDKMQRSALLAGTKDVFVRTDFCGIRTAAGYVSLLEDRWAKLENDALPRVRALAVGELSEQNLVEVKVLAAIHFARSFAFQEVFERIVAELAAQAPAEIGAQHDVRAAFRRSQGRDPERGELESMVGDQFRSLVAGGLALERMGYA